MKDKINKRVTIATDTTKRVFNNTEMFVQAVAMVIVAGFAFWALNKLKADFESWEYGVILGALIVMGLRGAWETLRFLAAERK